MESDAKSGLFIAYGLAVGMVGLAIFVGPQWGIVLCAVGAILVLHGHFPSLFKSKMAKIVGALVMLVIVAGALYWHRGKRTDTPPPPDIAKAIPPPALAPIPVTQPPPAPKAIPPRTKEPKHTNAGAGQPPPPLPPAKPFNESDLKEAQRMTLEYVAANHGAQITKNDLNQYFRKQFDAGHTPKLLAWGPRPYRRPDMSPSLSGESDPTYILVPCPANSGSIKGITITNSFIPIYDASGCINLENICIDSAFMGVVNASNGVDLVPIIEAAGKSAKENGGHLPMPERGPSCVTTPPTPKQ
jgi:hypothetical protein